MDEKIEIVDNDNKIVGIVPRSIVHQQGLNHREIGIILVDHESRVLFQKRSMSKPTYPGKWVISAGGHLQIEESPYEAAKRELREELGLETDLYFLMVNFYEGPSENNHVYWYVARYDREKIVPDRDEIEKVEFLSRGELNKRMKINSGDFDLPANLSFYNEYSLKAYNIVNEFWNGDFNNIIDAQENIESEAIYLIDNQDNVVGKVDRVKANQNPLLLHREVGVLIYDENNRILFQKRAKTKKVKPGMWTISAAGHVDFGESKIESAKRELYEETGIEVNNLKEITSVWKYAENETHNMTLFVGKYHSKKQLYPDFDEVDKLKYMNREELFQLLKSGEEIGNISRQLAEDFWEGKLL
jgi:isopentenyl-diphosphate Delta-isomerase